ncbi:MAG: 16S rRNA (guanine(527)-N(7))-methyltransferase RsmG [Rhizobiales bacterium]|nr:16S rRNA (guanine(527)-N(7))-methyltransferase RsmG [Hyphomicrobiales bacterium]
MIDQKTPQTDREASLRITPVSRETAARLDRFVDHFLKWQRVVQLVAPSTLNRLWTRHIADSLQLLADIEHAQEVVDVGSGGGFPGLVLSIARPDKKFHLVESDTRKASFLREAARVSDASAEVYAERVESVTKRMTTAIHMVTARAFAPLPKLLELTEPLFANGARAAFLKSQDIDGELTTAAKSWNVNFQLRNSLTDPRGRILLITSAERR